MSPKNTLQILIWGTFFRSKQGKLSWFAFEVCIPDWYCTASRSGQGKLSWFLSLKKKTQKSKHLQTVIPNVLQELATDTELSKTSAGVHRWLCYPMCYAFAGDLCRSPLTMMISSTETELSKTSSRISLAQCWTAWLGDIVKQGWCAPLVLLQGLQAHDRKIIVWNVPTVVVIATSTQMPSCSRQQGILSCSAECHRQFEEEVQG